MVTLYDSPIELSTTHYADSAAVLAEFLIRLLQPSIADWYMATVNWWERLIRRDDAE
jgi:hypothetical protein